MARSLRDIALLFIAAVPTLFGSVSKAAADDVTPATPPTPQDDNAWTVTTKATAGNHLTIGGASVVLPDNWGRIGGFYAHQTTDAQTWVNYNIPVRYGSDTTTYSLRNHSNSTVKTQIAAGCYEGGFLLKDLSVGSCLGNVSYQLNVPGITTNLNQAGANLSAYPAAVATQLGKINYNIPAARAPKQHTTYSQSGIQYAPVVTTIEVSDPWKSNVRVDLKVNNGYSRKASAGIQIDLTNSDAANASDLALPKAPGKGTKVALAVSYEKPFHGGTFEDITGQKEKPQVVTALKASTEIFGETLGHRVTAEFTAATTVKGPYTASAGLSVSYHF